MSLLRLVARRAGHEVMKSIDIGCGKKKISGSIGIDFSEMTDADFFVDLNKEALPFDDNSVDFAFSSHTLEHLSKDGFFNVMREVYRVLKPGSQFYVLVPYFSVNANLANPFHNNDLCFNEHTFRFFSSEMMTSALLPSEYETPSCPQWGLRYSANFELGLEFRTKRVRFFYYPEFRDLAPVERAAMRRSRFDVVDQIAYTLEVIKPCPIRPETAPIAGSDDPFIHVSAQIEFLKEQIKWIENSKSLPLDFAEIKEFADRIYLFEGLYSAGQNYIPVNQLVFELDDYIQYCRRFIDAALSQETQR